MTTKSKMAVFVCWFIVMACFVGIYLKLTAGTIRWISSEDIKPHLKNGDIICRLGDQVWSLYFREISPIDKRFSHLGIVKLNGENITVINAEGKVLEGRDSVNEITLLDFIKAARAIGVYRFSGIDGNLIVEEAEKQKGKAFDWDFDMTDNQKLYCTELLYVVLKDIVPDYRIKTIMLKELGKEIVPLDAVSNSIDFSEIVYVNNYQR